MKMLVRMITIVLVALFITGCGHQDESYDYNPLPTESVPSDFRIDEMFVSWKPYRTVEELMQDATNVFEGKLINITFEAFHNQNQSSGKTLYTIYEFKVSNSYKGRNAGTVCVRVPGGIKGYKVSQQYNAMVQAGVKKEDIRINSMSGFTPPTVGETYLVVAKDLGGSYLNILTQYHFVFSPSRENKISKFGHEEIKAFFQAKANPWIWGAVGVCLLGIGGVIYIKCTRRKNRVTDKEE